MDTLDACPDTPVDDKKLLKRIAVGAVLLGTAITASGLATGNALEDMLADARDPAPVVHVGVTARTAMKQIPVRPYVDVLANMQFAEGRRERHPVAVGARAATGDGGGRAKVETTGRVPAVELMIATPAIRNLIREGKTHQIQSAIQTGSQYGMQTMDQALASLYARGFITMEQALARAIYPEELRNIMERGEASRGGGISGGL